MISLIMKRGPDRKELTEAIYAIVFLIPPGRATSYGLIARAIGYPGHSRMVGSILSGSEIQGMPAHRVVNSQGVLSGRDAFGRSGEMQRKLEAEGIVIVNDRIRDWKAVRWDPMAEI